MSTRMPLNVLELYSRNLDTQRGSHVVFVRNPVPDYITELSENNLDIIKTGLITSSWLTANQ